MKQEQENYSENEAYWNKRSEIFDTQILTTYEEAYRKTIDYTKKYLKDSGKALDIGCGTGVTTIELAGSVAEMTAVDTAPEMLRQAREKAKKAEAGNIDFIQGDMFMEELKPGTYDAVMIFNVLLYMGKPTIPSSIELKSANDSKFSFKTLRSSFPLLNSTD